MCLWCNGHDNIQAYNDPLGGKPGDRTPLQLSKSDTCFNGRVQRHWRMCEVESIL